MHGKLFPHVYILWASVKLVWQQQILYAQKLTRPVYDLGFHVFLRLGMESLESPGSDVTL